MFTPAVLDASSPAIAARIFSIGSYPGSFQGELNAFAKIAASETRADPP